MTDTAVLFERQGETLVPDHSVRGPWDPSVMHGGVPSALLMRAVESAQPGHDLAVARITVDLLSGVPVGPVSVSARIVKPGRRFQVVEAELEAGGRTAAVARAVRLRRDPAFGVPGTGPADPPMPAPEDCPPLPQITRPQAGYFHPDAMEIRHVRGEAGSGAMAAWFRLFRDIEPGEPPSVLARTAAAADFSNGIAWVLPWDRYTFVNTELSIHLHRVPEGDWIGLDARTHVGPEGIGLATGVLHDRSGPIGVSAQTLYLDHRS